MTVKNHDKKNKLYRCLKGNSKSVKEMCIENKESV